MPEDELRPEEGTLISGNATSTNNAVIGVSSRVAREYSGEVLMREDGDDDAMTPDSSNHNVTIHPLNFGYNVKIGCQNFAVETVERLIKNLEAFLNDPSGTEKKWMKDKKLL